MQAKADAEHKATRDEVRERVTGFAARSSIPLQRHRPRHAHQQLEARVRRMESTSIFRRSGRIRRRSGRGPIDPAMAKKHSMQPQLSPAYFVR